ncbi:MAG: hypothetical protein ACRDJV_07930 [Actinomycetota bacterium]
MATTERRLEEVRRLEATWDLSPDDDLPQPPAPEVFNPASLLTGAWIVVIASIFVFAPAPSDSNAAVPVWGQLLLTAFMGGFFATLYGLLTDRSWGVAASAATAGVGMTIAVACAATDHHTGAWWAYEMTAFTALGALSVAALRHRARERRAATHT